ncbi:MAG: PaaI family thioesterase [Bacillati bacterium ANGP1]|uniref:PaaI family thioesterase n=2 Tax=Candidatus Segetimicrobium genomatis TaxID=2569760 RepID=A0A537M597_9BACT|nr:MAG: PaaI family thioesterase [Terrabacteria group bacterium ANGP1]
MASLPLETLSEVLRRSPYHRLLGLEMVRASPGEVVIRMPFRGDLLAGDDEIGRYVHGGAIASLIDTAGDFAIIAAVGYDVPTIDLRIDYLRPATQGTLTATGRAVKAGRSVAVADVEVVGEDGKPVAVGRGVFKT